MNEKVPFQQHTLKWTSQKIERFWDYESQNSAKKEACFTHLLGDALIRLAQNNEALVEPVLDYGAGVGYLTELLVQRGIQTSACDFSPSSVDSIKQRLSGEKTFSTCELLSGLPSAIQENTYGTVFVIETLEHLLEEWREKTLQEVIRILKPGGYVVVTVPNAENLDAAMVMCADCGAIFHRVQHIASYTEDSLSALMAGRGFTKVVCRAINLHSLTDEAVRKKKRIRARLRKLFASLRLVESRPVSTPNLIYIKRKGMSICGAISDMSEVTDRKMANELS